MEYKKPQATIIQGNVGIYPLTTADQVILADGTRLEKDGKINVDVANSANSAKLGGKAPEYYLQPRNLLDNSDFRNPVNQRGKTNYTGGGYTIDRWLLGINAVVVNVLGDGIEVTGGDSTYNAPYVQKVPENLTGKTVTLAVCDSDGVITTVTGAVQTDSACITNAAWGNISFYHNSSDGTLWAQINVNYGGSKIFRWAALYEGSYTADTLPPYVPKGYAVELAECQRYFERLGSTFSEQIGNIVYVISGAKSFVCSLQCSRKRIPHPSVLISGVNNYRLLLKDATNASVYSAAPISSFDSITIQEPFISFRVNMTNAITQNSWIQLQRNDEATAAYIDVSADL